MLNVFLACHICGKAFVISFSKYIFAASCLQTYKVLVVHGGVYANGCTLHLIVNRICFLHLTRTVGYQQASMIRLRKASLYVVFLQWRIQVGSRSPGACGRP